MLTITARNTHGKVLVWEYADPVAAARRIITLAESRHLKVIEQVTGDRDDCEVFAREAFGAILQNTPRDAKGRFPGSVEHAIREVARQWAMRPVHGLDDLPPGTKVRVPDGGDEVFVVGGHDRERNKVEVCYPDHARRALYDPAVLAKVDE